MTAMYCDCHEVSARSTTLQISDLLRCLGTIDTALSCVFEEQHMFVGHYRNGLRPAFLRCQAITAHQYEEEGTKEVYMAHGEED